MGNNIKAILIFICIVVFLILVCIYNVNRAKEEEFLKLKQKYEPLNTVDLLNLDKMTPEEFKKTRDLWQEYFGLRRTSEGKNDEIKKIVPDFDGLCRAINKEAARRDREKRIKFKLERENKNYERFLKEVKGITDEKIIKEKFARLEIIRKREQNSAPRGVFTISGYDDSDNLKAGNGITEDEVKERKEFKEYCNSLND